MNRALRILIPLLFVAVDLSFAQRATSYDPMTPKGTAFTFPQFMYVPSDLREFVKRADLIIEGEVKSVSPGRFRDHLPDSLETDIEISVKRVLKGSKLETLTISQIGGKIEGFELIASDDPLMEQGEHYILFLLKDNRPNLPDYKARRYIVASGQHGKFRIEDNRIKPSPKAVLKDYEGKTVDEFIAEISALFGPKGKQ